MSPGSLMHQYARFSLFVVSIFLLFFLAFRAYTDADRYIDIQTKLLQQKNTDQTIRQKVDALLELLSAGWYDHYTQTKTTQQTLEHQAAFFQHRSFIWFYYFLASVILFSILYALLDLKTLLLFIAAASLVALVTALFSPLLLMSVGKQLPILGEVILSYESKSIVSTIMKLFKQHNYLIASIILLFSVSIPFLKAILILTYGLFQETGMMRRTARWIEKAGKWSMADVFIVAILVVFFSTNQDIHTTMQIAPGLYFFVTYVLLSILGTMLITRKER